MSVRTVSALGKVSVNNVRRSQGGERAKYLLSAQRWVETRTVSLLNIHQSNDIFGQIAIKAFQYLRRLLLLFSAI